mgnify:CR=1 FL=1|jgi:hypothetical protein
MASILKVDSMQGVTSAGDITITSEGGAATQSLQPSLTQAWVNLNGSTFATRDSFNIASATDSGTGNYKVTFTNVCANDDYAHTCACRTGSFIVPIIQDGVYATNTMGIYTMNTSSTLVDANYAIMQMNGDLA